MSESHGAPDEALTDALDEASRELYATALERQRSGDLGAAEALYRQILARVPRSFHALHMLGVLRGQHGDWRAAAELIDRALRIDPGVAAAHANLGSALRLTGRPDEALASYERALTLQSDHVGALKGCAAIFQQQARWSEALACSVLVLHLEPDFVDGWILKATALDELGRSEQAVVAYRKALEFEAAMEPGQASAVRAALGTRQPATVLPGGLAQELFDQYAEVFDAHLDRLGYRAPELLVAELPGTPAKSLDVLDLGCGTGLGGALLAPWARTLTGVDISKKMLEQARLKEAYDALYAADIGAYLATAAPASFDLVFAADVFNYIGDLTPVFAGVRAALRPGGLFAFTTERGEGAAPVLHETMRFTHPLAYLQSLAAAPGWQVESLAESVLREERGEGVAGHLTVLRRSDDAVAAAAARRIERAARPVPSAREQSELKATYERALALHRASDLDAAEALYRAILEQMPESFHATHMLGVLLGQRGQPAESERLIGEAVAIDPTVAAAQANLGNALHVLGREREALARYDEALRLHPEHLPALRGRTVALVELERDEEALAACDLVVAREPSSGDAWLQRYTVLRRMNRKAEAVESLRQALAHPGSTDPDKLRYMLASMGGEPAPPAAPTAYVRRLFDRNADHFDLHLVERLQYRTPELVAALLRPLLPEGGGLDVLDLGCGTGLSGAALKPWAGTLTGVDVSEGMLAEARAKQVYTRLEAAEITPFLRDKAACFDLVAAVDVFCYVGDLAGIVDAVGPALRPGGLFAFSTEASDGGEIVLHESLRYAHSRAYLERLVASPAWRIERLTDDVLRLEGGAPVRGHLMVVRRLS